MRWMGLFFCAAVLLGGPSSVRGQSNPASEQERARQLVAGGKPAEAILIYEELLRGSPGNAALLVNLAVAQYQAGRYPDVVEHCRAALRLQPDLTTAWLFLGAAYLKSGDAAHAVEPFEKVLQARPQERNAGLMLAEALLQLERDDEAAARFLAVAQLLPGEPRAWYGLARSCHGVVQQAAATIGGGPDAAYGNLLAGDTALRLGRYGIAFHCYREALDARPGMREALDALARVYRASGHADWAGQVEQRLGDASPPDCEQVGPACSFQAGRYDELLRPTETPQPPALWYWRAKACEKLEDEALEKLTKLPESAQLHELQARRLDGQGVYREAAQQWRQALRLAPENLALRKALALSLYNGSDFEQAKPVLEALLAGDPNSAELNYLYGNTLLLNEEAHKAVPYLQRALQIDSTSVRTNAALGSALLQLGSFQDATPHLIAAGASDEDGRIHFQLARAYQGAGREVEARQALEQYQTILKTAEARRQAAEGNAQIVAP